ncbi:MAG: integral rane sensor signal transduction histidine kinase, partial [Deltaproteobacteria bacterium]|nr:integral rane sensor signal transduction histidine kinase [Deltaproteobacteria bacterium]
PDPIDGGPPRSKDRLNPAAGVPLAGAQRGRRVTPLAGWSVVVAFLLIGIGLIATVWTTRSSVIAASDAVRRGQAQALEQAVRADLADLEGPPTSDDLSSMLRTHGDEGLRYLAMVEGRDVVSEVGTAIGTGAAETIAGNERLHEVDGRLRLQVRPFRRLRNGGRNWRVIIELEPVQATELRDAATLSLGIGAVATASLLGVAIVLVLREARRNAEERERERERRLATLGEMSAVLAHEIKNPLASLKGNAQLLAAMLPVGEKPRSKAERVVDEAVRLEKLTNDLLRFVRTGAIRREHVDPGALLREAATSMPGDVTVDTERAPRTWSLDAARIREVVVNLVDNALAAGPPVVASVRTEDQRLVFEISDHGEGVADEDRAKIFEPFFTGKTQGTGLGLAVARRVIEQHGGTITVLTNPGGGALFRAEIPES